MWFSHHLNLSLHYTEYVLVIFCHPSTGLSCLCQAAEGLYVSLVRFFRQPGEVVPNMDLRESPGVAI
jgi:hypothetical protein